MLTAIYDDGILSTQRKSLIVGGKHMLHPASPIYEVVIGVLLLAVTLCSVISLPTIVALWQDKKEQEERKNNFERGGDEQ